MQCYELLPDGKLIPGIPVDTSGEIPVVPILLSGVPCDASHRHAVFSDALCSVLEKAGMDGTFLHPAPRLMSCDLDVRNQIYLLPPTRETKDDVLLLHHFQGHNAEVAFKEPRQASVVHSNEYQAFDRAIGTMRVRSTLVTVGRSGRLTIQAKFGVPEPSKLREVFAILGPKFRMRTKTTMLWCVGGDAKEKTSLRILEIPF